MIRKKGITLIELIIALSLISVAVSISSFSIKLYDGIQLEAEYEEMRVGILNFFDLASLYCLNRNISANILINRGDSEIMLSNGSTTFMSYSIDGMKFGNTINQSNKIEVDSNGQLRGSGTADFEFKDKIKGELVITAITNNVKVRKK